MHDHVGRTRRLAARLAELGVDSFLISHPANLGYLFNFWGSSGLGLWRDGDFLLLVDSRYHLQAEQDSKGCRVVRASGSLMDELDQVVRDRGLGRLGVEGAALSADDFARVAQIHGAPPVIGHYPVEEMRAIKETSEVSLLKRAYAIAERAIEHTLHRLSAGITELELAAELAYQGMKAGGEGLAFEPIVASGERTALPHAAPTGKRIQETEPLLVDCGFRYRHYSSDLTRMIRPEAVGEKMLDCVRSARQAAVDQIRPGVDTELVDGAAREVIAEAGYGDCFAHGAGHGIGIEVHELPPVSARHHGRLEVGMVLTIEPAIYVPGRGGIRLEDALIVTEDGYQWLV